MKVVQINSVCGSGSTGKICVAVSELLVAKEIENYIFYALGESNYPLGRKYMSSWEIKYQALMSKIFGNYGFESRSATRRLIKMIDDISPDIVHLHNLHSHNVNLDILFTYLKKKKTKIFWTFHDCWAFTSYCMYFDMVYCEKWKDGCQNCPQCKKFSWFLDRSKWVYSKKKKLFLGLDLTIITPSKWLADIVKQSFFKGYPIKVINNGIDLNVFTPIESDFRKKHDIFEDKIILLGVANKWEKRKGLDIFIQLAERLDANKFQIVLIGTNESIDRILPHNIISIHKTANQKELAEIYSVADLFLNPTREDNFPTVNIESIACGTPVVTFRTGGSPEVIDKMCGSVIECDDILALLREINRIFDMNVFSKENCLLRAQQFDMQQKFNEYINLYEMSKME